MSRFLLADGGQSGCRLVHVVKGERSGAGLGSGLSRKARDGSESATLRAFEEALRAMDSPPKDVDVLAFGLSGFDESPEAALALAEGIRSIVRAERVILTNDAITSYLGAMGFEPGVVVAAGTGVIALAGDESGGFARGDGWGYILGDDGGGYYVGRRGLASALRASEGRGGSESLLERATQMFGPPAEIKRRVYSAANPVKEVAAFATEVAEAARKGDSEAKKIWADAASEAALTATSTLDRVIAPEHPASFSWTGSLFKARDLMLEPFKRHVAENRASTIPVEPKGDTLLGAELLASAEETTMFAPLIHVFDE